MLDRIKDSESLIFEKDKELDNLSSWNKCLKNELQVIFF